MSDRCCWILCRDQIRKQCTLPAQRIYPMGSCSCKSGVRVQFVVSSSISDETFAEDAAEFNTSMSHLEGLSSEGFLSDLKDSMNSAGIGDFTIDEIGSATATIKVTQPQKLVWRHPA